MKTSTGWSDNEHASVPEPPPTHFAIWLWRHTRRIIVFVVGSTVLLIGVLMIIAPGPAFVVIPLGLAILATEFVWARRWLAYAKHHLQALTAGPLAKDSNNNSGKPMKSRTETPADYPKRRHVEEANADWNRPLADYDPPSYTADSVIQKEGTLADPGDVHAVKRKFMTCTSAGDVPVLVDSGGMPLNPLGRTGLRGRGRLRRWGRNQAADAVLTRLAPSHARLQVLLIQRRDNHQFALPGGFVDADETMDAAASRELLEETGLRLEFDSTAVIYAGVVDDPRNTDNAWMETTVFHRHLIGSDIDLTTLTAGDDAASVAWHDVDENLLSLMYASHGTYVRLAVEQFNSAD